MAGASDAGDPALATDLEGRLFLAWLAGDSTEWRLYASSSEDGGTVWSTPVAVTPPGEPIHPHAESSPRLLAAGAGRLALVWATSMEVPGREWPASNIRFSRSLDGGRTWSAAITLNDDTTSAPGSHSFHGVTLRGDSGLVIAWLDERHVTASAAPADSEAFDDASIYSVQSEDFGRSWSANTPRWDRVCPCCRAQLASHGEEVIGSWRRHYPGQIRDIVVASLGEVPHRVRLDNWQIAGCPHSGPAVAIDTAGRRHLAWFNGAEKGTGVYYSSWSGELPDSSAAVPVVTGASLPTAHVSLAWSSIYGPVVACDVDSSGARTITLAQLGGSRSTTVRVSRAEGGTYPQVVLDRSGAIVVWASRDEARATLALARVPLGKQQ